jgi:hypothetical protein
MKKIATIAAIFVFILVLTKIANQVPPPPPPGYAFWLYGQHVVGCSATEITLADKHESQTHFEKDDSWPPCLVFYGNQMLNLYLSRGAKTHYIDSKPTEWWRKMM